MKTVVDVGRLKGTVSKSIDLDQQANFNKFLRQSGNLNIDTDIR